MSENKERDTVISDPSTVLILIRSALLMKQMFVNCADRALAVFLGQILLVHLRETAVSASALSCNMD